MPKDKDLKRLVRQRMAETGEPYTKALTSIVVAAPAVTGHRRAELLELIGLLGDPHQNERAFSQLKELAPEELGPLAVVGTRHVSAKVRRRSCQLLDDLALTPETVAALEACVEDPEPRVRAAALHTLACEHCKPDGVCLDQRAIAERAADDRSARVRRAVAMSLSWNPTQSDEWSVAMATRLLADPSAEIRRFAQIAVDRIEGQRRTDEARRRLPEPLRTRTERHPRKWVAIKDDRIAAVEPTPSWKRRNLDAQLYFVAVS